jgi:hypothetical protein
MKAPIFIYALLGSIYLIPGWDTHSGFSIRL